MKLIAAALVLMALYVGLRVSSYRHTQWCLDHGHYVAFLVGNGGEPVVVLTGVCAEAR